MHLPRVTPQPKRWNGRRADDDCFLLLLLLLPPLTWGWYARPSEQATGGWLGARRSAVRSPTTRARARRQWGYADAFVKAAWMDGWRGLPSREVHAGTKLPSQRRGRALWTQPWEKKLVMPSGRPTYSPPPLSGAREAMGDQGVRP
ncbi:hypothetical protein F4780DRAFT_181713 [Xylariomycetidae sp. FL0641]|nr:hypothetical protein F4780DRAFT_181713 [Xylariomycetidae sp. FL0641]